MRIGISWILTMFLLAVSVTCLAADPAALEDFWDKASYSLGQQIGKDLKGQGTDIDPEALSAGIADALSETTPQLSPEEIQTTLREFKQKLVDEQRAKDAERRQKEQEQREANRAAGKKFLEANAKNEGVVTLPSGVQYQVVQEGTGQKPGPTDTVTVHYRGTLVDGTEFDSSYRRNEPTEFQVDQVIQGWTEILQLMKVGAKWKVFIPPELAYSERGPLAGQTLLFEIELLGVK